MSKIQQQAQDTVFASLFTSLDEGDADIGTAYLTSSAQGVRRNMRAQEWAEAAFPHSTLKAEFQELTVGRLFDTYMNARRTLSTANELVMQRAMRVTH